MHRTSLSHSRLTHYSYAILRIYTRSTISWVVAIMNYQLSQEVCIFDMCRYPFLFGIYVKLIVLRAHSFLIFFNSFYFISFYYYLLLIFLFYFISLCFILAQSHLNFSSPSYTIHFSAQTLTPIKLATLSLDPY